MALTDHLTDRHYEEIMNRRAEGKVYRIRLNDEQLDLLGTCLLQYMSGRGGKRKRWIAENLYARFRERRVGNPSLGEE